MSAWQDGVAKLHPAYFALVMSTGIVAIAAQLVGMAIIPTVLFWLNIGFYAILWLLTLARIVFFRDRLLADFMDHNRCIGFLTTVAGTCVLGNQFALRDLPGIALGLWWFGIVLWLLLTYAVLTVLTLKQTKPSLAEGINGGWLVAVVATQSVSVLGGLLAPGFAGDSRELTLFFTLAIWLVGGMLYVWIITLIFYRYTFFTLDPAQLAPPYWINMGAMAISTLAGAVLIANAEQSALLREFLPFLKGMTLLCWSTATWWIPMLLILGCWRHGPRRIPLSYDPMYWSAVFPLGMYTACTFRLAGVIDFPLLKVIPNCFIYVAILAWLAALVGLLASFAPRRGSA